MDLQVLNDMSSDSKKASSGGKPYFATVSEVVGNKCKLMIDGDTEVVNTLYCTLQSVNAGQRVCLYYAGSQIVVLGGVR